MAGKNINCIYNEKGPYCSNSNLPKAFKFLGISFGPRMCPLFDKDTKCYLKEEYPRPKINKQRSEMGKTNLNSQKKYLFHSFDTGIEFFETLEEAKEFAKEILLNDGNEWSCEAEAGGSLIAEVILYSDLKITDKKENYCQCDENEECRCDKEEWPYSDEFDWVSDLVWKPAQQKTEKVIDVESICKELSETTPQNYNDLLIIANQFQKKYERINLKNVLHYMVNLSSYQNINIDSASDYTEYAIQNFHSFFSHSEPSPIQMPIELILGDGKHRFSQTITNDQNPTLVISYAGEPAEIGPKFAADETLGKTDDNEGFIFKDPRVFMQFTNPASVDSLIKSLFDLKKLFKENTALEDAQEWLSIWLKAHDDVIQGKSCHIARDHWVTRAHIDEIEDAIRFWRKRVKDLKKAAKGEMEKG